MPPPLFFIYSLVILHRANTRDFSRGIRGQKGKLDLSRKTRDFSRGIRAQDAQAGPAFAGEEERKGMYTSDASTGDLHILQTQLKDYAEEGLYPFHMPGHKRRVRPAPDLPFQWDLTEVPGTDDLHDARGILRQAMERSARLWGADRTWYLVNGSTCGLLAGIRALVRRDGEVLCARNCHKAVFHALELAGARVHWLLPRVVESWGICAGISGGQVEQALRRHPGVKAVILTSPTYEGILSDVKEICRLCHEKNIPVLVDEAHGAHLLPVSEREGFPAGALSCGADLVVQSPHKTLPSLTQTAFLHLRGNLVDPEKIERALDIFETSSPSYPLLASLDGCTGILRGKGDQLFARWGLRLGRFLEEVRPLRHLRVFGASRQGDAGPDTGQESVRDPREDIRFLLHDPGKILIDAAPAGMTGRELADLLRRDWRMETEMAQGSLLLVMTSPCDSEDALDRLAQALLAVDCGRTEPAEKGAEEGGADHGPGGPGPGAERAADPAAGGVPLPHTACTLAEAAEQEAEAVPLASARGRICAEYLYFYPPGIPLLAPGEIITRRHLEFLERSQESGAQLYRHRQSASIRCLRE